VLWAEALPIEIVQRMAATATEQRMPLPAMLQSLGDAVKRLLAYAYQAHWAESLRIIQTAFRVRPRRTLLGKPHAALHRRLPYA